jgi:hypothetical protein
VRVEEIVHETAARPTPPSGGSRIKLRRSEATLMLESGTEVLNRLEGPVPDGATTRGAIALAGLPY